MTDTANLRLHVDVTGESALAKLSKSAGGAEAAEQGLRTAATATNRALTQQTGVSLTSATALRAYASAAQALARGDIGSAASQIGGLSARAGTLAAVMNPLGLAVTTVAVTVGAFAYATAQAQKENFEFAKAIAFTGNAAGVTKDQLRQMAEEMDEIGGTTRGAASEALTALAASGQVAGQNLQEFATIAEQLRQKIGKPIADSVRDLEELGRNPVEASKKLQQQYGYLTVEVYRQIKALQEQGRTQEAANLAQETFLEAQSQRAAEAAKDVGYLQSAWAGVKQAIGEVRDELLDLGSPDSLDSLNRQIERLQKRIEQVGAGGNDGATEELRKQLAAVVRLRDVEEKASRAKAAEEAKALADTNAAIAAVDRRAGIEAAQAATTRQVAQARLGSGAASVQRELSDSLSQFGAYASTLDALRSADLIKENEYYAKKGKLIQQNADARVKAVNDEIAAARREQDAVRAAAEEDISRTNTTDGKPILDKEPERIRIRADAAQKLLALQDKIKDKEVEVADIRRQSDAELNNLSITQRGVIQSVLEQLRQETAEYELQATAGAHAAEAIERLRISKTLEKSGLPGAADKADAVVRARDVAKDKSILADSERELELLRLGNEERREEQASRALSAAATTEQVLALSQNIKAMERADLFNQQLESMKQEFDAFSEDYVLTNEEMYDEIDARVREHVMTEEEAAAARRLIAKKETDTRIKATKEMFGGLSNLMSSENRKLFNIGKAAAIANATISAGEAIMNAYKTSPWYLGLALGISAAANLYAQIEQIKNTQPGFKSGGFTGNRSVDEVAGVVHGQEFVMNAAATSRIGARNLDALQTGSATVLPGRGLAANSSHISVPNVTIVDQSTGKKDWDIEMMEGRMQIIARDAADHAVATKTPKVVSGQINDPNSSISRAIGQNVQAQRRRL